MALRGLLSTCCSSLFPFGRAQPSVCSAVPFQARKLANVSKGGYSHSRRLENSPLLRNVRSLSSKYIVGSRAMASEQIMDKVQERLMFEDE